METKKTVKIVKKIILGKQKPTPILRFLCWFSILWDLLIGLYMTGSGIAFLIKGNVFSADGLLKDFTQEFCFLYAFAHVISLLSAILMYRLKRTGFYLYLLANIGMPVILFVYLENFRSDYMVVVFTLLMLFYSLLK